MKFKLRAIPAAATVVLLMTACGGGGGGGGPTATSGVVTDAHLVGATVVCNVDGTGVADAKNASTTTDMLGNGTFSFANGCTAPLVVTGGTNGLGGPAFTGVLTAPADTSSSLRVVSPLSSMIASGASASAVASALGLAGTVDLLHTDPAASTTAPTVTAAALAVQQVTQQLAQLVTSLGSNSASTVPTSATYQAVAAAVAAQLANGSLSTQLSSGSLVTAVLGAMTGSSATAISGAGGAANLSMAVSTALANQVAAIVAAGAGGSATSGTVFNAATPLQANNAIVSNVLSTIATSGALTPTTAGNASSGIAAAATTTTAATPSNYLYLSGNAIGWDDGLGNGATSYSTTQFAAGQGIPVLWPMATAAKLSFTLSANGTPVLPSTVTAAVSVSSPSNAGLTAYISNVGLSQNGSVITVTVPVGGWVSATSSNGTVVGSAMTGSVAQYSLNTGAANSIAVGSAVSAALSTMGANSSMISAGTYKVTMVLNNLPLTLANGTALPAQSVTVPSAGGASTTVTGVGLTGYITLTAH